MDDTAEIRARLDRIASLAGRDTGAPSLLEEVRRLLEEGERAVRDAAAEPPDPTGAAGVAGREPGGAAAAPARAGEGAP